MKTNIFKWSSSVVALIIVLATTSCNKWLDLSPIDHYGSKSYWQTEEQVIGYVDGLHKHHRDTYWTHTIIYGEVRAGQYVDGTSHDGMTTSYGDLRLQNLSPERTGVSNYANYYGRITNCNLLLKRTENNDFGAPETIRYARAMAHGLRAYYYFDLYRVFGSVPLRFDVEVIDGVLDPNILYKEQAKASEVLAYIKEDLKKSLELFGDNNSFDPLNRNARKSYWSKAATEALAAEVHLWSAKVAVGDQQPIPADLQIAKKHLKNLESNYQLALEENFSKVFDTTNKGNKEVIFAIRFQEGEAENSNSVYTYSIDTGATEASGFRSDGTPWKDPLNLKRGNTMSMEYIHEMFTQFDPADTRRDATFITSYIKKPETGDQLHLNGIHTRKNIGHINQTGDRVYDGDYILYRLPWVYLSLAEIANEEGDNNEVAKYINLVRERAYGDAWAPQHEYTPGDYTANTLAILKEKDKEFIQEGQRWWDLRRLTLTKGGEYLVFTPEGNPKGGTPLLNKATEAHKVLWPLDKTLLSKEKLLNQTPGYAK